MEGHTSPTSIHCPFDAWYFNGQSSMHVFSYSTNGESQLVQLLVVPSQLAQLESHAVQVPLMTTSSVFVQLASHLLAVVTTRGSVQEVQVVVEDAHVRHDESHAKHWLPDSIVFPVSQLFCHVLSLRSSFWLITHDVQVVIVPDQVLQLEFQETHSSVVESYTDSPLGQVLTQDVPYKINLLGDVTHDRQLVDIPEQV